MFYCDPSAWVKRYVEEPGSAAIHGFFQRHERMSSSTLGFVEVVAALSRRLSPNDLTLIDSRVKSDWRSLVHLPFTDAIMLSAAELARQYNLRGADAVHLATVVEVQRKLKEIDEAVVLVAWDRELLNAARAAGLEILNPVAGLTQ